MVAILKEFFNQPFFIIVGGFTTISTIVGFMSIIFLSIKGVLPVILKLGVGLSSRKIAIIGSETVCLNLKNTLMESKIFNEKNIDKVFLNNIDKAKDATIFLVDWTSSKDKIEQIFNARKSNQTPIIIYAESESIPRETIKDIGNRANTVVVNFRGRLLNDILTSMVTTSYER
ncbi:MAG: hypothetical protein HQK96_14705 [Nitrospirae bacterium]|nr:hypothetical protein [Nitrospirota bacterium]